MQRLSPATAIISILSFILGAWLVFDGARKLVTGYYRRADHRTRTLDYARLGDRLTTLRHGLPFPLPRSALGCQWDHRRARIQNEIRARHRNLHLHTLLCHTRDHR